MSKAHESAERKGFIAGLQGKTMDACPYEDHRGGGFGQIVTWSRGFINAWMEGWIKGWKENHRIIGHPDWSKAVPHRCLVCGYETDVTNLCRRCKVPMEVVEGSYRR